MCSVESMFWNNWKGSTKTPMYDGKITIWLHQTDFTTNVFRNTSRLSFQASYFTALNDCIKVIYICLSQIVIAVAGLSKKGNCETYLEKYYDFQKTDKISRSKSIRRKMKKTGLKNSPERHCDEVLYYLSRSLQL